MKRIWGLNITFADVEYCYSWEGMSETLNYYGNYKSCYFLRQVPIGETDFLAEDERVDEVAGHGSYGLLNQTIL